MKKTRMAKRFTSMALTAAMVMSLGGMTALAATAKEFNPTLTKKVTTDGNSYAPNEKFLFEVNQGTAGETDAGDPILAGPQGGLFLTNQGEIEYKATDYTDLLDSYDKTLNLNVNELLLNVPGIYHYEISEVIPEDADKYAGIEYDTTKHDVYVYVVKNGDKLDYSITTSKAGGADLPKAENIQFENDYGKTNAGVYDLTVAKKITGNQGVLSEEFTFTVVINNTKDTNKQYKVEVVKDDGNPDITMLMQGETGIYSLDDDDTIKIYGLTSADSYTVTETTANQNGYTAYVVEKSYDEVDATADLENDNLGSTKTGTLTDADGFITIINDKNVSTPTGIVMSFAPYILMVGLAGVFAVLFLRKRREEF